MSLDATSNQELSALRIVLSNCDAKRDHNYRLGADSFTITTAEYELLRSRSVPSEIAQINVEVTVCPNCGFAMGATSGAARSATRRVDIDAPWIEAEDDQPDEHRKVLVTNNLKAANAFGRMSHIWIIDLLQHSEKHGWCGYTDGDRLIEGITHWQYAPDEVRP